MRPIIIEPKSPEDRCLLFSLRSACNEFSEVTNIHDTDTDTLVSKFFPWLNETYGLFLQEDPKHKGHIDSPMFVSNEQKYFIFQIKFANTE